MWLNLTGMAESNEERKLEIVWENLIFSRNFLILAVWCSIAGIANKISVFILLGMIWSSVYFVW